MNKEIEVKELRIGNYITFDGGIPTRVYELTEYFINDCHPKETNIQGIPLSPAILEKCMTFTNNGINDIYVVDSGDMELTIAVSDIDNGIVNLYTSVNYFYLENIKYLHQLQNLYFALTGQELQITL